MPVQTHARRFLSLSLACAAACLAAGGCAKDAKPAGGTASQLPTARMEALIAADTVISDGEKMKADADRTSDSDLRKRGEARAAEGWRMHAAAAAMKSE